MSDHQPVLHGVHHTAFPTWKPKETVEFYRDTLGLPVLHAITAKGWGRDEHPDFLHFFFDAGNGAAIAFFYYIGTEPLEEPAGPRGYLGMARHTSWRVETEAELKEWRERLVAKGVTISEEIQHEVIKSLYFTLTRTRLSIHHASHPLVIMLIHHGVLVLKT